MTWHIHTTISVLVVLRTYVYDVRTYMTWLIRVAWLINVRHDSLLIHVSMKWSGIPCAPLQHTLQHTLQRTLQRTLQHTLCNYRMVWNSVHSSATHAATHTATSTATHTATHTATRTLQLQNGPEFCAFLSKLLSFCCGVATSSRILKIIGIFCKRAL